MAASSASGVNGLRRQRVAPSSSAILRKSGAGEFTHSQPCAACEWDEREIY
jgi:hypothetical protein